MRSSQTLRFICVTLATACVLALYTLGSHFNWVEIWDRPLAVLMGISSILLLAVSIYLSVQPTEKLSKTQQYLYQLGQPEEKQFRSFSAFTLLTIIAAGVGFAFITFSYHAILTDDSHSDPAAVLRFAKQTQQDGGPGQLLADLYSGEYTQANQHPFYIGLLSLSPDLESGKRLSLIATTLTMLMVVVYLIKSHSWQAAAITATLLATNHTFGYFSGLATCEAWLTLFVSAAWVALNLALVNRGKKQAYAFWLVSGACLGMAYMTKGTGLLFFVVLVLTSFTSGLQRRDNTSHLQKLKASLVATIFAVSGWLLIAHPLLIRNTLVYDSPTFNVNTYFLYMDEFPDDPQIQAKLAASDTLDQIRRDFLSRHTTADLLQREIRGVGWESFIFVRSLGPSPIGEGRVLAGIPIMLLLLLTLIHLERPMQIFILGTIAASILVFAWYIPIAAGERFTLPLVPMVMAYAGIGLQNITTNKPQFSYRWVLVGCLTWTTVWAALATVTL